MTTTTASPLPPSSAEIEQGVALWKRKQVSGMVMLAALLFLGAGTLNWPQGWLYVVLYALSIIAQAVILLPRSPGLLAERSKLQPGTKRWDVLLTTTGLGLATMAALVVAGLDFRNGWTGPLPLWTLVLAVVVTGIGWVLVVWSMAVNAFFSATVRLQTDRNQVVVSDGPYQYVRHPGYVGAILTNLATSFVLGSLWALIPTAIVVLFFIARTLGEDPTLQRELPGYREYAQHVRYRLIPGVW
jgi:protein-S-isoprenylcysteine O-methyltransferase Ste14